MRVDAVVVGSGLCGALAAQHLEAAGHSVLVLEGGPGLPRSLPGDVVGFQRAVAPVTRAPDATWGFRAPKGFEWHRVRARGGRTLLWGGWMERAPADYFEARTCMGAAWPAVFDDLAPWFRRAERVLSVRSGRRGRLHQTLAKLGHDSGTKRECVLLGQRRMLTAADLSLRAQVRCDSPVLQVERTTRGLVVTLTSGERIATRRVVLAASPIETARIVEASLPPEQRRRRVELFDHLIAGAIAIGPRERPGRHPTASAEPSAVMHPDRGARTRFTTEVRGPTPLETLDAEDLKNLGFTPEEAAKHSFFVVFAMGETDPSSPRYVELERDRLDELGRPMPRFVRRAHTTSETSLAKQMNRQVLRLARALAASPDRAFLIYDALDFSSGGHEVGTCLGRIDDHGEVNGVPGLFIADGAGVPAATDRHPSLTLAANALRVTEAVWRSFSSD